MFLVTSDRIFISCDYDAIMMQRCVHGIHRAGVRFGTTLALRWAQRCLVWVLREGRIPCYGPWAYGICAPPDTGVVLFLVVNSAKPCVQVVCIRSLLFQK